MRRIAAVAALLACMCANASPKDDLLRSVVLLKNKTEWGATPIELSNTLAELRTKFDLSSGLTDEQTAVTEDLIKVATAAIRILSNSDVAALDLQSCYYEVRWKEGVDCRPKFNAVMAELSMAGDAEKANSANPPGDLISQILSGLAFTAIHRKAEASLTSLKQK